MEKYWLWLSLLEKLNVKQKIYLIEKYKTPDVIFNLSKDELRRICKKEIVDDIFDEKYRDKLDGKIEQMKEKNIKIINIYDDTYPHNLKQIIDYPICLFAIGNEKILNDISIGIVGCRQCSSYGRFISKTIATAMVKNNIAVISGMAIGIDTYAHIGALSKNEKTIAVLGSGIDVIYPKQNLNLYNNIIKKNGVIISEYPMGMLPNPMNFPARNRIISGIANGIIVIEAKEKSGALITADFALEQGKEVYAMPGNITSKNSMGTNKLIKDGAKMVTCLTDILEDF